MTKSDATDKQSNSTPKNRNRRNRKKHVNLDGANSDQHRNRKNRVDPEEQNRRKHTDPFQQSKRSTPSPKVDVHVYPGEKNLFSSIFKVVFTSDGVFFN